MSDDCLLCGGRELSLILKDGDWVAVPCECKEQKRIARMIKNSGLADEQRKVSLEQFRPTKATVPMFKAVSTYLRDFAEIETGPGCDKGFGLTGPVGIGKTHMTLAVANWLLDRSMPVVWVTTPDLLAELRVAQHRDGGAEMERKIDLMAEVQVAIFDDVAKEKTSEWVQTQYFRIIDARYRNHLPTCWTSNWDINGIAERLGDAVASRLYALANGRMVHVEAPDYRVRGGKP